MKSLGRFALALVVAASVSLVLAPRPDAQEGVTLGSLVCKTQPGTKVKLFLSSSVAIECTFKTQAGQEHYKGELGFLGIDLSKKTAETLNFTVVGLTTNVKMGSHSLSGGYVGATISAGVYKKGYGSTQLVGGIKKSFSLVPSIDTFEGTGLTAGTTRMSLEPK